MTEVKRKLIPYRVNYVCDKCVKGHMKPTKEVLLSNPPQYPHVCDYCGEKKTFWKRYPRIEYEQYN
jgi:hypothetical protein